MSFRKYHSLFPVVRTVVTLFLVGDLSAGEAVPPPITGGAEFSPVADSVSADTGSPAAWYAEAQKHLKGIGVPRDPVQAVALLQEAAMQGHADAFATLGYCYSEGVGVAKSDEQARLYFEQGTDAGSVAAQSNLGLFLIKGRGGERDPARGVALMEKAIESGSPKTAALLGEIFYFGQHADGQPDYKKAHAILLEPARNGDPAAQNMVGVILKDGRLGEKDPDAARVWFERAALQGHGKACHNLAELWNYQSTDRWARIEALRWLIVGERLKETMAYYFLEDIRPGLAADELKTAGTLAEITLKSVVRQ